MDESTLLVDVMQTTIRISSFSQLTKQYRKNGEPHQQQNHANRQNFHQSWEMELLWFLASGRLPREATAVGKLRQPSDKVSIRERLGGLMPSFGLIHVDGRDSRLLVCG